MPSAPRIGAFPCDECDKTFSRKEYVDRHKRLKHLGLRPFECVCGNAYARSDLLRRHKKTCAKALEAESPDGVNLPPTRPKKRESTGKKSSSDSPGTQAMASGSSTYLNTDVGGSSYAPPSLSPSSTLDNSSSEQSSPHTPYQIDPAISQPHTSSFQSYVPVGFTQDELMATEVLEDLLRSPQFAKAAPSTNAGVSIATSASGLSANANVEATLISPGVAHRAGFDFAPVSIVSTVAAGHEGDKSLQAGGSSTLATQLAAYDQATGLEFTPEAVALADYFNRGGIGGITALDLGFSYEPTLYPSHVFEQPVLHTEEERKYHLPSGKFALGSLCGWSIPTTDALSRYASHAAKAFLPCIPVVHTESMVMNELPLHTAFALTVAGAAYDPQGETFSNEMIVQKRLHLVKSFNEPGKPWRERFALAQSMLLYQLLGLFHKDESQRVLSHTFHGAMIMMLKQLDLIKEISTNKVTPPPLGTPPHEVEHLWKRWIEIETWRRVAFIMYLTDLETATRFSCAPLLPFCEVTLDMPADEDLWNAKSSVEWQQLALNRREQRQPVSFVAAVRALLSPSISDVFTTDHAIYAEISRLAVLPLLVLMRTLAYLELKTEEAIRQADPFRSMLNGIGMFESKENENLDLLRRIKRGKAFLSMMPKALKDEGKDWFDEVMPNGPPRSEQSTHVTMESHLRSASAELKSRFPSFAQTETFV